MNLETTCRIPRDQLLGLLNTMSPIEQQRITAEMPAADLPPELAIRFRRPGRFTRARMAVIAASFGISFAVGLAFAML